MLFYKYQNFWSFNDHEWTNIPSSHHKRHCIEIYTCWNVTAIRQLNRPPGKYHFNHPKLGFVFPLNATEHAQFHAVFQWKDQDYKFVIHFMSDPCMQFCWKCVFESKQNFKLIYFPKYSIFLLKHRNCTNSRAHWINPGQKFLALNSFSMENHT